MVKVTQVSLFGYMVSKETKESYEEPLPVYDISTGIYIFEYMENVAIVAEGHLVYTSDDNIDWPGLLIDHEVITGDPHRG